MTANFSSQTCPDALAPLATITSHGPTITWLACKLPFSILCWSIVDEAAVEHLLSHRDWCKPEYRGEAAAHGGMVSHRSGPVLSHLYAKKRKTKIDTFSLMSWFQLTCLKVESGGFWCSAFYRWTKVHDLLIQQRIRKDMLAQAVKESDAMLRYTQFKCHIPCFSWQNMY